MVSKENKGKKWDQRGGWGSNHKESNTKEFAHYSKCDGELMESFKQGSSIIIYIFKHSDCCVDSRKKEEGH